MCSEDTGDLELNPYIHTAMPSSICIIDTQSWKLHNHIILFCCQVNFNTRYTVRSLSELRHIEDRRYIFSSRERKEYKRKQAFSFYLFCKLLTSEDFLSCSLFQNCVRNYSATIKHTGQWPGSLENSQRQLLSQSSYSVRNGSQQKDTKFLMETGTWC